MKKISTVTATQSKNFRQQKLTIALDLGDRSSWYCVLDEAGAVLLEQRLGTTPKAMKEVFGKMPRRRIAPETGMHRLWVSRGVSELGHSGCFRLKFRRSYADVRIETAKVGTPLQAFAGESRAFEA
jgi:hypothetical protein